MYFSVSFSLFCIKDISYIDINTSYIYIDISSLMHADSKVSSDSFLASITYGHHLASWILQPWYSKKPRRKKTKFKLTLLCFYYGCLFG